MADFGPILNLGIAVAARDEEIAVAARDAEILAGAWRKFKRFFKLFWTTFYLRPDSYGYWYVISVLLKFVSILNFA